MDNVKSILILDDKIARGQKAALLDSYEQRVKAGNYLKAEGLARKAKMDWEEIRSFISRGATKDAFNKLQSSNENHEKNYELARILCFEGKFRSAIPICEELLSHSEVHLLTKMATHQVLALCYYELEQFQQSLTQIDRVVALESIYPHSEVSLFARTLNIRTLAKLKALSAAKQEQAILWQKIKDQQYSLNLKFQLIMYLKSAIELKRAQNKCSLSEKIAGMWLAKEMGSPIHEGLFLLDLSKSSNQTISELAKGDFACFEERFECMLHYKAKDHTSHDQMIYNEELYLKRPLKLVLLNESVSIDLETYSIQDLTLTDQSRELLQNISNQWIDKSELYKKIWKGNEYHPLENDSAIRTAIKRLRQQLNAPVVTSDYSITLAETIVIF